MSEPAFRRIHFIGVGGTGLSGLARLSLLMGYQVSGSDRQRPPLISDLESLGLRFQGGHVPDLVRQADLVVVSSAVANDNPEAVWAREAGIPVWKRHEFIPWLSGGRRMVAIAGTHGKTTTTALLSHILVECGNDPTCLVGGLVHNWGSNARLGSGDLFVVEADEYDRTFLALNPWLGVITSVEMDHPDCYPSLADLDDAFGQFVVRCRRVLACGDQDGVKRAVATAANVRWYGADSGADWRSLAWEGRTDGTRFKLAGPDGREHDATVPLWGEHSVANALAAIAAAYEVGVPPERALPALLSFKGVARRFSLRGCCSGVYLVDDYGHHPTQIRSVLDAARQRFPGAREVLVFQPHTFSRTEALFDEYATALSQADRAFVLPVYGARESGDAHALSARLAAAAGGEVLPGVEQASERLLAVLRPGDVLLNLGAGDNEQLTAELMRRMGCDGG